MSTELRHNLLATIQEQDDPDFVDDPTFPAPRGTAQALVISPKVKALVDKMTFADRVNLLRGPDRVTTTFDTASYLW